MDQVEEQSLQVDLATHDGQGSAEEAGYSTEVGCARPLGAIPDAQGVNFSVYAERASSVELLLFDQNDDLKPVCTIQLDPFKNKTFHFWHVYVKGALPGLHYAYRVDGPHDLSGQGDRYNKNKVLIDPYARGNIDSLWKRADAMTDADNLNTSMRSVVIDVTRYDWEGDRPLNRPMHETIIYELHVRGFTQSPSSQVRHPGTFAGIIEKIPYLQALGITAVELLPVFDFDEMEIKQYSPTGKPLTNYWGYDPICYFSPQSSYCISPEAGKHINEFRDMVKALHRAGIEVLLDVVFNHTGEGGQPGPTISLRGFANSSYYLLSPEDKQEYINYSGCGNTLNCNHPLTEKLVIDALHFWVKEMHVDGFRFDEAVILCRDENGHPLKYPPIIWRIELSEELAETKVIAEAWDAAGLYQVGNFPGYRWGEWNGRYRDSVRRFVKGDTGYSEGKTILGRLADSISGSAYLYQWSDRLPTNSVNFVTAHDGFTLNDLVSYNAKHNEENGENNRDGADDNFSWNCGVEGETTDPSVEQLRQRQVKNFAVILLLSQGVPMFVAGDEVRRTQQGNNNPYCQDNALSWFDWELVEKNRAMLRFFTSLIAFRKSHTCFQQGRFFTGEKNQRGIPDISWHGLQVDQPPWDDPNSHVLAFTLGGVLEGEPDIHVILNMDSQEHDFALPIVPDRKWYRLADTALPAPTDFAQPGTEILIAANTYPATSHSAIIFIAH